MAALHRLPHSNFTSTSTSYASSSSSSLRPEAHQFPAGLRVLVVDDDITCLRILEQMLRRCLYHVTTCSQAITALQLLREKKGRFDVILSDVYMPDMDGYKLLELVGLEMDLPVIMMSADGSTNAVLRGVKHGACDYLIKPVREEELKNIWQHVVRKRQNDSKLLEHSGSFEDTDRHRRGNDDFEYASSVNEGTEGTLKYQKKRSNPKEEDDGELENDDPSTSKKPRVVWSVELHQQFVSAVNQLGIDKAVPKRILELMNVPGLTRENVASHLQQKFRLYLKRISGVAQHAALPNTLCGPVDQNIKVGSLGRYDIQALAASGQIPPQTLAALHAELLGQPNGNLVTPIDQSAILQASLQGPKCAPVECSVAFGQPVVKCHPNISKHLQQSIMPVEDIPSSLGAWPSNNIGTLGPSSTLGGLAAQNGNVLMNLFQQQLQKSQPQSTLLESSRSISVQPSCLVVPSESTSIFHSGNSPTSVDRNCNATSSTFIDYSLPSSQSNNPSSVKQVSDGDLNCTGGRNAYSASRSVSSSLSSCSMTIDKRNGQEVQNSNIVFKPARPLSGFAQISDVQSSYSMTKPDKVLDQEADWNTRLVGKGAWFPTRLGVEEFQSPLNYSNHGKILAVDATHKVKHEPVVEYMDNSSAGMPTLSRFPLSDLLSVLTE